MQHSIRISFSSNRKFITLPPLFRLRPRQPLPPPLFRPLHFLLLPLLTLLRRLVPGFDISNDASPECLSNVELEYNNKSHPLGKDV